MTRMTKPERLKFERLAMKGLRKARTCRHHSPSHPAPTQSLGRFTQRLGGNCAARPSIVRTEKEMTMDTIKLNSGELEFQAGRLVKVDGMRLQYMDGYRLIALVNDLASSLKSAMEKPEYVAAAFIERMANFTTPEDEFADPEFSHKGEYDDVDEYVSDMPDDRLCDEYALFMSMVREARTIRGALPAPEWSGSPCPEDPDNCWIDDKTGERIKA